MTKDPATMRYIMKVGDLVKYGKWYEGPRTMGLVLETSGIYDHFLLVAWDDEIEWEGIEEIEVVSESR